MLRFVATRFGATLAVLAAVVTLTFAMVHLAPGTPLLGEPERRTLDPAALERTRARFGLDDPLPLQYARWVANVSRGNLGESFSQRRPVGAIIAERLPNTLLLGGTSLLLGFAIGMAVAVFQARAAGTWADAAAGAVVLVFYSTPSFWLGLVLLIGFGQSLGWLPLGGMTTPGYDAPGPLAYAADVLRHLVLPAATLALVQLAVVARHQRGILVDTLAEPWIRAARSRGLGERRVLLRHALRASLAPVIALAGTMVPALLAGSVLVETVFGWPGMGRLAFDAVQTRDYNLIIGTTLVAGVLVALGSLTADLAQAAVDPRQRR